MPSDDMARHGLADRPLYAVATLITGLVCMIILGFASLAPAASAETEGQAIVAAAQAIQSQSYPAESFASAKYIYCFDGGTTAGATAGGPDPHPEGSYSNCNDIGRVGFDCRGLALYSVYQGTAGAVTLPTSTAQAQYSGASSYGGSYISLSSVQPGDLVFFGSSSSDVEHVGIVVSGTGTSANIVSAINEEDGITTHTVHWFEGGFSWVAAVAIPGVGNTVGPPPPPPSPDGNFTSGGASQILFQDPGSSTWYLLTGGGANNAAGGVYPFVTNWQEPAWEISGDFLGNGSDQVLFQDPGSSTWYLLTGGGANNAAGGLYPFVTNWERPAWEISGDFLGNGSDQVLFQDPGSSTWYLVTGGGANNAAGGLYPFVTNWQQPAWALSGTSTTKHVLNATLAGAGSGLITDGGSLSCPGTCSATYFQGTTVTLTATPTAGSTFSGWSGACSGTGACSVVMGSDQSVTANFALSNTTVSNSGSSTGGSGTGASGGSGTSPSSTGTPGSSPAAKTGPAGQIQVKGTKITHKTLTSKQRLANALAACNKVKSRRKRVICEAAAKRHYDRELQLARRQAIAACKHIKDPAKQKACVSNAERRYG